jgi:hypothetical protein
MNTTAETIKVQANQAFARALDAANLINDDNARHAVQAAAHAACLAAHAAANH